MAEISLGKLIASRRQQVQLTQVDVARMVPGLTRSALNSIENGATKTVSADVANELVRVLPLTMAELVKAMGYALPTPRSPLPEELARDLETADSFELESVRALLLGYRIARQGLARREPS